MKKVIDLNLLRKPNLTEFLAGGNSAIFFEFHFMELSKGNALLNMRQSLAITKKYFTQAVLLKDLEDLIVSTDRTKPFTPDILVSRESTKNFPNFLTHLYSESVESDIKFADLVSNSKAYFLNRYSDAIQVQQAILSFRSKLTKEQLKHLRVTKSVPDDVRNLAVNLGFSLADSMLKSKGYTFAGSELLVRYCILGYLLMLFWCTNSGIETFPVDKMVNDITDLWYIAIGSFFDGVLTLETKMLWMESEFRTIMKEYGHFGRVLQ